MITRRNAFVSYLKPLMPVWLISILKRLEYLKMFSGVEKRECNICGYNGFFKVGGTTPRIDSVCPSCGSYERQRLLAMVLADVNADDTSSILFFAPEECLKSYLTQIGKKFTTADYIEKTDLKIDIENMNINSNSFEFVICSHVLEHVDDERALSEIERVLKISGVAYIMVPMIDGWDNTYENNSITSEKDRFVHFGQNDHQRIYGRDIENKMLNAGFKVSFFMAEPELCVKHSLVKGEKVFILTKPGGCSQLN